MMEEDKASSNYSRWRSSSERVQLEVKPRNPRTLFASLSWKRWLILLAIVIVVSLVVGFVAGYLVRRAYHQKDLQELNSNQEEVRTAKQEELTTIKPATQPQKNLTEVLDELKKKIDADRILSYINLESGKIYPPGSLSGSQVPGELVNGHCGDLNIQLRSNLSLEVLLSKPDDNHAVLLINGEEVYTGNSSVPETQRPFVAYTQSGTAEGPPVYASFGRPSDFLQHVNYTATICVLRHGMLNVYNKIVNAHRAGCAGVVLYPDPAQFPNLSVFDALIANAKMIDGDPLTPGMASIGGYNIGVPKAKDAFLPPPIPVFSASSDVARKILQLITMSPSPTLPQDWSGSLSNVSYGDEKSLSDIVLIRISNKMDTVNISRGICAVRGDVDTDKFLVVGTHHDQAGWGDVDPITGHAVMREMMRIIATTDYKPRRSIIFMTEDATYLNVGTKEWIEENLKEFGDRVVGYLALNGILTSGSKLLVRSSPPLQEFVKDIVSKYKSNEEVVYSQVTGLHHYRSYIADLAVPVIELSYTNQTNSSTLNELPTCCHRALSQTKKSIITQTAELNLDIIMKMSGEAVLPYNLIELREIITTGTNTVVKTSIADQSLIGRFIKTANFLSRILKTLYTRISQARGYNIEDVSVRRVNDALTGITRAFILPQGVPMIDPNDPTNTIRNLNNRNMLIGCTSTNDYEMVVFPGLQELAKSASSEMKEEIDKHMTEIYISLTVALDYSRRAIMDPVTNQLSPL